MTGCGCRIEIPTDATVCPPNVKLLDAHIVYCPLHQAAGQMREALKQLAKAYCLEFGCENWQTASPDYVQHALAASEGRTP